MNPRKEVVIDYTNWRGAWQPVGVESADDERSSEKRIA
jgi:hypothetical protein